jgi:16S rRNA (adenine1518-N6/adenine1519-N6)-dimethyltransferase
MPYAQPPVIIDSIKSLNTVVTAAFSQRRKTLRNSLKKLILEANIIALDIDPTIRAECLSLEDFAKISQFVHQNPLPEE